MVEGMGFSKNDVDVFEIYEAVSTVIKLYAELEILDIMNKGGN